MSAALAILPDAAPLAANDNRPIRIASVYDMTNRPVYMYGRGLQTNGATYDLFTQSHLYDAHNRRVKTVEDGVVRYNIYDAAGTLVQVYDATSDTRTDYVSGPNGALARIKRDAGVDTTSFIHTDHLGTARAATGTGGNLLWEDFHTPFGESLTHPDATDDQGDYTGHIRDKASGLTYMQARYYDPTIGRFMGVDPVGFLGTGEPGMFNRYSYVLNNPVNDIDPDGRVCSLCRANPGYATILGGGGAITVSTPIQEFEAILMGTPISNSSGLTFSTPQMNFGPQAVSTPIAAPQSSSVSTPIASAGGITVANDAHSIASNAAQKWAGTNLTCTECASDIASALTDAGIEGKYIDHVATFGSRDPFVQSNTTGGTISENGVHTGVLVDGIVYDNINPNGLPRHEWVGDLYSRTGASIKERDFDK